MRPTTEEVLARTRVHFALVVVFGAFLSLIGLGIMTRLAVPLASTIAGKHTDFVFTLSMSINAALGGSLAVSLGAVTIQTRRVKHHKLRNKELETKLQPYGHSTRGSGKIDKQARTRIPEQASVENQEQSVAEGQ
jgi:hypothetical protein